MEGTEHLQYSSEAIKTEYLFFCDINHINLFVEDQGKEFEYETIFKRLLGQQYKIRKIFGVGGKVELIKFFKEFGVTNSADHKIKNVYIADGDFDRYICEDDMISSPNFIYLETYNIENYFIDKKACEKFAKGQLKCSDSEVEIKVDFNNWKNKIVEQASRLFFYYCYVKKEYPSEETVARTPYLFINDKDGLERVGAFEVYRDFVLTLNPKAEDEVKKIREYFYKKYDTTSNIICGKFLLESLYCHIRSVTKIKFRKDDFRWHLICEFDIETLDYVRNRIFAILGV